MKTNGKIYDLEDRTFQFAIDCRSLARKIEKTIANIEDLKQLIRASGSVPANYIEANESLGKKDFLMKIRISRKEAKESRLWLKLLFIPNEILNDERKRLIIEATELMNIFGSILKNSI